MNFLNKAKETASKAINSEDKGGSPMTNPFLKPGNVSKPAVPGAQKPGLPGKPPTPGAKPGAKPGLPGARPNIPGKPGLPGAKPVVPTPIVEEVVPTGLAPVVEEAVVPTEPVVEAVVEETVAPVAETPKAVEESKVVEEAKESEVNEEELSPQRRAALTRKRNAEAKKKAETNKTNSGVKDSAVAVEIGDNVVVPETDLDFADCVSAIKSQFVDAEWEHFRATTTTTMSEIMISNDMNKPQLHDLLSQVATLRDEICVAFNDTKTLYESLTAKEDGLIDITKRLNGRGSNTEERKVSGTLAVMNYKTKEGHNINLFELLDETRSRYNFLKTIMDSIEFKKSVLLTMLSSLKMEK